MDTTITPAQNSDSSVSSILESSFKAGKFKQLILDIFQILYKVTLLPFLMALSGGTNHSCRFHPTCSTYAKDCFKNTNVVFAFFLITWRLLRCNPWFPTKVYFDDAPKMRGSH